jgi:hypothetical protein
MAGEAERTSEHVLILEVLPGSANVIEQVIDGCQLGSATWQGGRAAATSESGKIKQEYLWLSRKLPRPCKCLMPNLYRTLDDPSRVTGSVSRSPRILLRCLLCVDLIGL